MKSIAQILGHTGNAWQAQYNSPEWLARSRQRIRLTPFCQSCKRQGIKLNAHHVVYVRGRMLHEYADSDLVVLCDDCHGLLHEVINAFRRIAATGTASGMAAIALALKNRLKLEGENAVLNRLIR